MLKGKKFNVKGPCIPEDHYMVDISDRLMKIKKMVEDREYFVINRARQYGKTTTLAALERYLAYEYIVISISFQGLGDESFSTEEKFCQTFLKEIKQQLRFSGVSQEERESWFNKDVIRFDLLSDHITDLCEGKKVVLMIDEVDRASNHRVFLNFLGILRTKFQARSKRKDFTFHSVILAGVYDIKNIKLKMVQEGMHSLVGGERNYDSPWNIAENFDEDMSFSAEEIAGMLYYYEADHKTGMVIPEIAKEIYYFTSGYPFLVSLICKYIHEKLEKDWSKAGVVEAVKLITKEPQLNTLFDDLFKNIHNNEELSKFMYKVLIEGKRFKFSQGSPAISAGLRYAFIRIIDGQIAIHNKIFEVIITDYFIDKERIEGVKELSKNKLSW